MRNKKIIQQGVFLLGLALSTLAMASSGAKPAPTQPPKLKSRPAPQEALTLPVTDKVTDALAAFSWERRVPGLVSEVAISEVTRTGKFSVVVSTIHDPDGWPPNGFNIVRYSDRGTVEFSKPIKIPVKSLALAADASLLFVSYYNNELKAYDPKGRELWALETDCRPLLVPAQQRILCFHDDDAEADRVFKLIDFKGKILAEFKVADLVGAAGVGLKNDVLGLKIAPDGKAVFVSLNAGRVVLVELTDSPKTLWSSQVSGEVADLAVSAALEKGRRRMSVLYTPRGAEHELDQRITVFDSGLIGDAGWSVEPERHVEHLEIDNEGRLVFAQGNGFEGQYLAAYAPETAKSGGGVLSRKWFRGVSRNAEYYAPMQRQVGGVSVLFDEFEPAKAHAKLYWLRNNGETLWNVPVQRTSAEEAVNLYVYAMSAPGPGQRIALGLDNSWLRVFRVKR